MKPQRRSLRKRRPEKLKDIGTNKPKNLGHIKASNSLYTYRITTDDPKEDLKALGAKCDLCPLKNNKAVRTKHAAEYRKNVFCGYIPDSDDITFNHPFSGIKNVIFQRMLDSVGLDNKSVGQTYAIQCIADRFTPKETFEQAQKCCSARFHNDVNEYDNVVSLGNKVLNIFYQTELKETQTHGQYYSDKVLSTFSLNYAANTNLDAATMMYKDLLRLETGPNSIPEPEIIMLNSLRDVKDFVSWIQTLDLDKIVIDLETSYIDKLHSWPDIWWDQIILCAGVSIGPGKAYIIPEEIIMTGECLEAILPLVTRKDLVGANFIFDVLILKGLYYRMFDKSPEITIYRDTFMMSYVLDEISGRHSLKEHASWFDDRGYDDVIDQYITKKHDSYSQVPSDVLHRYLARDVNYTYMLDDVFVRRLKDAGQYEWPYMNVLRRAQNTFVDVEYMGVYTDVWKVKEARKEIEPQVEMLLKKIKKIVGNANFNPNSSKQLGKFLYDECGLDLPKSGKGKRTTNQKAIDELNKRLENVPMEKSTAKQLLNVLGKYRTMVKLLSTYINKIEFFMDERKFSHHRFNLARSVTGRLEGGILMTLPADRYAGPLIRGCFRAPVSIDDLRTEHQNVVKAYIESRLNKSCSIEPLRVVSIEKDNPNYDKSDPDSPEKITVYEPAGSFVLIDNDYSQAEVRTAGFLSQDAAILEVYRLGKDIHDTIARISFKIIETLKVTKDQRRIAKGIVFGYLYGMVYQTLIGKSMGFEDGHERFITKDEAKEIFDSFEDYVKEFRDWRTLQFELLKKIGEISTPTGRKRRVPLITDKNKFRVRNQACNFPVQSLANDVALLAVCEINDFFKSKNLPVWPVIFLHDGIYMYCFNDKNLIEYAKEQTIRIMEKVGAFVQSLPYMNREAPEVVKFKADCDLRIYWA